MPSAKNFAGRDINKIFNDLDLSAQGKGMLLFPFLVLLKLKLVLTSQSDQFSLEFYYYKLNNWKIKSI